MWLWVQNNNLFSVFILIQFILCLDASSVPLPVSNPTSSDCWFKTESGAWRRHLVHPRRWIFSQMNKSFSLLLNLCCCFFLKAQKNYRWLTSTFEHIREEETEFWLCSIPPSLIGNIAFSNINWLRVEVAKYKADRQTDEE